MKCDECGCGILPPPPAGSEPTPFVHPATTPKWPLVLSIVGVVAALAVIAVALLPLFDNDDDEVRTGTTVEGVTSTVVPVASASSTPATSEPPRPTVTTATTVATSVVSSIATSSTAVTSTSTTDSTGAAGSSSSTSSTTPETTTSGVTTTTNATTTTSVTTTTMPAGFPSPVIVTLVESTCTAPDSTDSRGNRITFNPLLTVDGVPDTAWRCEGASIHEVLLYTLAKPSDVSVVGAIPGYAGADPYNRIDRFDQNRRVTSARWACLGATGSETASVTQAFADDRRMQAMPVTGFSGCSKVLFEILDSSRPGNRDYTAVSEIGIYGPA